MAKRKSVNERLAVLERQAADVRVRAVEASEFRLVDRAGRVRAMLDLTRSGPRLAMMHEDGEVALEVTLTREGPGLRLADESGRTRVFLGATRGTARFGMADRDGSQRVFLGLGTSGDPVLTLYDALQRTVWTTGTSEKVPRATKPSKSTAKRPRARTK